MVDKKSFLVVGVISAVFLFSPPPQYQGTYNVLSSWSLQEKEFTQIGFIFDRLPKFKAEEVFDSGQTKITFTNISSVKTEFDWQELINNPLIERLDYHQEGKNLIVEINRRGAFLPAEVFQDGSIFLIQLKEGDKNFPLVFDQKPADDSAAYPIFRKITFRASLKSPLKKASVLIQNQPVEFSAIKVSSHNYFFQFFANIEKDKQYATKAVIRDDQERTTVASWNFEGQIPIETELGPQRFKYLGWWGQINADGVSVRKTPDTSLEKLGTFSSANRVKVLREVTGQTINDSNLWYEIDGGQFPHSFVFSEYVAPIIQPEPPKEFTMPPEVKENEYWIDVNLTNKILTLFLYQQPVFSTYFSPGREENPTAEGVFRIWYKLKKARMQGGPPLHEYKYDLADVPNVLYYNESYAVHGTYWHDNFGTPRSAGCTNLTQGDAALIFDAVNPKLKPEEESIFSSRRNAGTVVYNHY